MKLQHEHSRAISSLRFNDGEVSIVVELPDSTFRMREQRSSDFRLSREQGRDLAAAIIEWLETPDPTQCPIQTGRTDGDMTP